MNWSAKFLSRLKVFLKKTVRRFFQRKRPFRLTKGGWIFILYTIGVGAGAINTGNNLLYLIFGIFLGVILASGVLSDLSLWYVRAELDFPHAIESGKYNLIGFRVTNHKKYFPSVSLLVEIEGDLRGEPVTLRRYIPVLFPNEKRHTHFVYKPLNRGWFQVRQMRVSTRFPFGLLYKWWRIDRHVLKEDKAGFIVHPEVWPVDVQALSERIEGDEEAARMDRKGDGTTVYSVREYRESDNLKRIHWKASAKRDMGSWAERSRWLVREMEADEKKESLLCWPSLDEFPSLNEAEVENMLQFTVSLLKALASSEHKARLIVPGRSAQGDAIVYRVRPLYADNLLQSTIDFVSLFEERDPLAAQSMKYLEEDKTVSFKSVKGRTAFLFDLYRLWQKEQRRAA